MCDDDDDDDNDGIARTRLRLPVQPYTRTRAGVLPDGGCADDRYAAGGFKQHYDGYFCLCTCNDSEEGVFCSGAGVHDDGVTKVADFLGVFSEARQGGWEGDLIAFNTTSAFSDHFTMDEPGGRANYTGVSQSLNAASFVWRGYMSGVDCAFKGKCESVCGAEAQFRAWSDGCH